MTSYYPTTILSENSKTGCSINLPIKGHCKPTATCAKHCYAKSGHTRLPVSQKKQIWVSLYLAGKSLSALIVECKSHTSVRLSGTGDLNTNHLPAIFKLATQCPNTQFWGMTRKVDIAQAVNNKYPNLHLLLSVDNSSPSTVWNYSGAMCWGPRMAEDVVPQDSRIKIIFPCHHAGHVKSTIEKDPRDCQAVRHNISGCMECGRCWNW
jgi:hypothetical protein